MSWRRRCGGTEVDDGFASTRLRLQSVGKRNVECPLNLECAQCAASQSHSGTGTWTAVAAIRSQRDRTKSICSFTERSSNPGGGVGIILDMRKTPTTAQYIGKHRSRKAAV